MSKLRNVVLIGAAAVGLGLLSPHSAKAMDPANRADLEFIANNDATLQANAADLRIGPDKLWPLTNTLYPAEAVIANGQDILKGKEYQLRDGEAALLGRVDPGNFEAIDAANDLMVLEQIARTHPGVVVLERDSYGRATRINDHGRVIGGENVKTIISPEGLIGDILLVDQTGNPVNAAGITGVRDGHILWHPGKSANDEDATVRYPMELVRLINMNYIRGRVSGQIPPLPLGLCPEGEVSRGHDPVTGIIVCVPQIPGPRGPAGLAGQSCTSNSDCPSGICGSAGTCIPGGNGTPSGPRAIGFNIGGRVNYLQIARAAETETTGPSGKKKTHTETVNDAQTNAGVLLTYLFDNGIGFSGRAAYNQFGGQQRGSNFMGSAGVAFGGQSWLATIGYGMMNETVKLDDKAISITRKRSAQGVDLTAVVDKAYGEGNSRIGGAVQLFAGNGDSGYTIKIPGLKDRSHGGNFSLTEVDATAYWIPFANDVIGIGPQISVQNINRHEEAGGYAQTNLVFGVRIEGNHWYVVPSYVTSTESTTGAKSNGTGFMLQVGAYDKMPTP